MDEGEKTKRVGGDPHPSKTREGCEGCSIGRYGGEQKDQCNFSKGI